ncbi:MAG: UDP-2,3-diacylglucosamine diphosphatase LpxI [Akkermansia sp.]
MQEAAPEAPTLGILAGAGEYPMMMLKGAKRDGRRVIGVGFKGAVSKEFGEACDEFASFRVGALEAPLRFFQQHRVTEIVMTGQLKPSCIYTMWPDATARRLLAQMDRRNAHSIFGAVCDFLKPLGITVLSSTTYLEEYMPTEGPVSGPRLHDDILKQARAGMRMAREIARLDIGQSLIVHQGKALCVEAYKGTNECIEEGGHRDFSPILCKVTKPGHDMRFDVPCVGIGTIRHCEAAGIKTIILEANKTMLLQAQQVHELCAKAGISIHALPYPQDDEPAPALEHEPSDDAQHARLLAAELARLGIGTCAVVCDGVVIAVGDCEGVEKCIKRASRYMKRLRFARLSNWICRLILGRSGAAPQPMLLASTEVLNTAQIKLATSKGIRLVD